jgi:predicted enzyme related to lactoylglutathione lyase
MVKHMRNACRSVAVLLVGIALGTVWTEHSAARQRPDAGVRLNSVGLSVSNFDQAFNFYTKTFGFREAFTLRDKAGKPTMAFLQISPTTFLQLVPANANRPPGLSSVLLEVDDVQAETARLRKAGVQVQDPRVSPNTRVTLTNVIDPEGFRVELLQLTPGSLIRNAAEAWK